MKDIEQLARQMADSSVEFVFGIPGSGPSLQLLDALEKLNVTFIRTHMEASAPLMAAGGWVAKAKPSASLSIRGPGLTNMLPGIAACHFERFPVTTISEAIASSTASGTAHKRIDHAALLGSITKGHFNLSDDIGFSGIIKCAESEIPGPVHLDLCSDSERIVQKKSGEANCFDESNLLPLLRDSKKPIVIAGTYAIRRQCMGSLASLSIPVFTTAAAKGTVDETLYHAAGPYTGVGLDLAPERRLMEMADLVVGIGLVHNEVLSAKPFKCPSINIVHQAHVPQSTGFGFQMLVPESRLSTILCELKTKAWGVEEIVALKEKLQKETLARPFSPAHVFEMIESVFCGQARIGLDTGNFCVLGEHLCRIRTPKMHLCSGQSRYMGVGIPLAIGAAIHDRTTPTITCVGDGSIGMFVAELKTAAEMKLPVCVILMRDSYFGSIRLAAASKKFSEKSLKITSPSWIKTIETFGIKSVEANSQNTVDDLLRKWQVSDGPLYIEVVFDPDSYMNSTGDIR